MPSRHRFPGMGADGANKRKQIILIVSLLAASFIVLGIYTLWDPGRADDAKAFQDEKAVERGADLFAQNCRQCHGDSGEGGNVAKRNPLALPLNRYDLQGYRTADDMTNGTPPDPVLVEQQLQFISGVISCGRANTQMPVWGDQNGGPLNAEQVRQLASLVVEGKWDLAKAAGDKIDVSLASTPEAPANPNVTKQSCGQVPRALAAGLAGEALLKYGCTGCHTTTGETGTGPTWKGVYGSQVTMTDGSTVTVDDAYLRESITNPNAKIVKGFSADTMPNNSGVITDAEVNALIDYIKTLK